MNDIKKLIKELDEIKNKEEEEIKRRKSNINNDYTLAKIDFVVIENINDNIETLNKIIAELEELQQRRIKRNTKNII